MKEYFDTITIPEIVYRESVMEGKDHVEVELIKNAKWIKVSQVKDKKLVKLLQTSLDDGESEAITLSLEMGADLILLDDSEYKTLPFAQRPISNNQLTVQHAQASNWWKWGLIHQKATF